MPLTDFQAELARLLAANRDPGSYLAGGAAIHLEPNSERYSNDLDYFHDSEARVARAFEADRTLLTKGGYDVALDMSLPGYVRAMVRRGAEATKVEWSHDTAWRFMPVVASPEVGYRLHPVDLAINKLLALVGRDEPRDLVDTLTVHRDVLPLGALCWAAAGKDPGFTPLTLLDLLRRRGVIRPNELARLRLARPLDPVELKQQWLAALEAADAFVRSRPTEEIGCLYYSPAAGRFVEPGPDDLVFPHHGRPGGVLPRVKG